MDGWLDYTTLRLIWACLLGVVFWGFMVMDGFDLGVGILLPFMSKTEVDKRILINTVGPVWEGNQVWLIVGIAILFLAWPLVFGVLFSSLYGLLFLMLSALMLRPVGFKFRSKLTHPTWRNFWDGCLFLGGFVPALSFGLFLGHVMLGLPFQLDQELRLIFTPNLHPLLHPFALFSGIFWVFMCTQQGSLYLLLKTEGELRQRIAQLQAPLIWVSHILCLILLGLWRNLLSHYDVVQKTDAASNPLAKKILLLPEVTQHTFLDWLPLQSQTFPIYSLFLILSLLMGFCLYKKRPLWAFVINSLIIGLAVFCVGLSRFPILVLSSTHLSHSLTVWDASSSYHTLGVLLFTTLVLLPIVLAYTAWAYKVMSGRVKAQWIHDKSGEIY